MISSFQQIHKVDIPWQPRPGVSFFDVAGSTGSGCGSPRAVGLVGRRPAAIPGDKRRFLMEISGWFWRKERDSFLERKVHFTYVTSHPMFFSKQMFNFSLYFVATSGVHVL